MHRSALMTNDNMIRRCWGVCPDFRKASHIWKNYSGPSVSGVGLIARRAAPWRFGSLDLWHFCCAAAAHFTAGPGGTCLSLAQINPTTAPAAELTVFCRVDYFAKYALPGWAISTLMLRSLPKSALNGTIRNFFVHGTCL